MFNNSNTPHHSPESKTHQFLRGSSSRIEEANLPAPLRWIVELIQRLIAVMFIITGNTIKMVFSPEDRPHGVGRHQIEVEMKRALQQLHYKPLQAKDLLPKREAKDE